MRVMVLGATGTAGRSAVPVLVRAGDQVVAHSRTPRGADWLRDVGATPFTGDLDDARLLRSRLTGCDAVIDLRVAVPSPARAALPWAWREYARLRDRAAGRLVEAALRAGVERVVHDTVTMVYADAADAELDEDSPVDAPGALAANLAAERHLARLTEAGGVGVALRFGQFYGPDDEFSRQLMRAAVKGRVPLFGPPDGWTSAVHTDDVGPALLLALTAPAGVYNVVDDEPLRRRDLLTLLAAAARVRQVRPMPAWPAKVAAAPPRALARSQRISAHRFTALGWQPTVASRRQGWPQAFARYLGTHGPGPADGTPRTEAKDRSASA